MKKTFYLKPDEEIISVIDRIVQAETAQVNLVIPARAQIWQNSINLKLLKRQADDFGKEVTLIVSDDSETAVAEKIGFSVKKEKDFPLELVQQEEILMTEPEPKPAQPADKDLIHLLVEELKPEKIKIQKEAKEPRKKMIDIINPDSQATKKFSLPRILKRKPPQPEPVIKVEPQAEPVEIRHRVRQARPSRWPKFFFIFISLALVVAAVVSYLALPTTEITLTPKSELVSFDLTVIGSKEISQVDQNLNKIPLQEIKLERTKSKEFLATGEKQLNERARGTITIYNEYSSSPQTLVATTRFESPEGKIFRIQRNIIVPGAEIVEGKIVAKTIEVEVVADQPGADYNIGPSDFTIPGFKGSPKYAGFYGKSKASMTGGSTEKIKVVSADDISQAEEDLTKLLENEIEQIIQEQIPTDLKLIEGGLRQEIERVTEIEEETKTERFNLELKATVWALLYNQEDLDNLIDFNLTSQISPDKIPLAGSQEINWQEPVIDWSKGEAIFSLDIQKKVAWQIDFEALRRDLAGQKAIEVRKYLANRTDIERAKVTFWPFWVKRVPSQENKIKVTIEFLD